MKATYFDSPESFRRWLARHHRTSGELLVGFYKKGSGKPSITWPQAVDQLLCFGWIDGVRHSIDADRYTIRVTPRRKGSIWSAVNIRRVHELKALGLMQPAGLEAYAGRDERKVERYSFERTHVRLAPQLEKLFRRRPRAWKFFQLQTPWYRKTSTWWVMSAKKEETRLRRLATLVKDSARGTRIAILGGSARQPGR